jgi:arabinose-5-phosphate isomerase
LKSEDLVAFAKMVIRQEAASVVAMADRLDNSFNDAVGAILDCKGRVIVSGMGKSGLVGRKIAATFNSTGISSFFLHPAEAVHGDLGLVRSDDIMLLISKSGQTDDLAYIIAAAKRIGVKIIVLNGTRNSPLEQRSDICLDCSVEMEACPSNVVPTSSSTAALVMGDALALALVKARDFTLDELASYHPAGFIGKRLLKHVSEVHHTGDDLPLIAANAPISEMLLVMTSKRLGCVFMVDTNGRAEGVFTDGDLRRLLERGKDFYSLIAGEAMNADPKSIPQTAILDAALAMMEKYSITQLATVDTERRLVGVIHLHDILRSKLV